MMQSKEIISLAAGLAAGNLTHDEILNKLGGDNALMNKVLALAVCVGAGAIATNLTRTIIEKTPLNDICDTADDMIGDTIGEAVDLIKFW